MIRVDVKHVVLYALQRAQIIQARSSNWHVGDYIAVHRNYGQTNSLFNLQQFRAYLIRLLANKHI